jgi:hypothetical protein
MAEAPPADVPAGGEGGDGQAGGRRKWMALVMAEKRAHPSWSLGQAMKSAKKKYRKSGKKTRRGGGDQMMGGATLSPASVGGRRRRSKKGSRKH